MKWFTDRGLKALEYQQKAITAIKKSMLERPISILAAAPSAGKTYMTIHIIDEYLKENPTHKVIVLAHGTTILRTQFHQEIVNINNLSPLCFKSKIVESHTEYDVNVGVNVCLPQTLYNKPIPKIDLLVVDEAHEFYFPTKTGDKNMMKNIINTCKPKKQLLLTGTPAKFILHNYHIVPITLNTLFDANMVTDLYVEIATSSYDFNLKNFNADNELTKKSTFNNNETNKTLDDLLEKVVNRLKSFKSTDIVNFIPNWLPTLKHLKKTMFACKSQLQARQVQNYFNNKGINSALSISDTDVNSEEIQRFLDDDDCLILIVVGRGILGFNMKELHNVVDMTMSYNINRVYQLMCRVVRPNGDMNKLFFKVVPNTLSDFYKYIMTAVMALSEEEFYLKFNGKNFNDMYIPVIKSNNNKIKTKNINITKTKSGIRPVEFEGLPAFSFFKDIYHKKDALLHTYALTTIRTVRDEFSDYKPNGYWTIERCIEDAKQFNKVIDWKIKSGGAYGASRRLGCYEKCTAHMNKVISLTIDSCIESAKRFNTVTEWRFKRRRAYEASKEVGCYEDCIAHMNDNSFTHWTVESCIENAKQFNVRKEWKNKFSGAYRAAKRLGCFDECVAHMEKNIVGIPWTVESCIESAKPFKLKSEWAKNTGGAYKAAKKLGCFDECVAHMTDNDRRLKL